MMASTVRCLTAKQRSHFTYLVTLPACICDFSSAKMIARSCRVFLCTRFVYDFSELLVIVPVVSHPFVLCLKVIDIAY